MLKLFNCLFILSSLFGISNGQIQVPTAIVRMVAAPGSSVAGELVVKATVNGISIKGKISGLTPGLHGFHIHEHGNLGNGCRNAGGHFNPFHHDHGDPRDLKRHIGDLGNIEADETGTATVNIFDSQASMNPSSRAYIGNLSVVVHADRDDLGRGGNPESLKTGNAGARMGCGIIEVQQQQQQQQTQQQQMISAAFAKVTIVPGTAANLAGELIVTATGGGVIIEGEITGLTPGLHGFHIHATGDLGNNCKNAGGHFNPFGLNHGGPQDVIRHVGDLGNIEADATGTANIQIFAIQPSLDPSSPAYIGNLAVVVHAGRDDLGKGGNPESLKTGNAGARLGCGIIEVQQQQQQTQQQAAFAKVTIVPGTAANLAGELIVTATGGGVIIEGEITGLTPGLHGFHIHATGDLGNNCKNAGGHFNPFGLNHGGPQDVIRHVGDLGNIEADATGTANIQIFAIQPSLDPSSPAYIGNLAVVVHAGRDDLGKGGNPESLKTGNAGARLGCGIIEVQQQQQQTQQQAAFAKVTIVPGTAANLAGELIVTATGGGVIIEGEITGLTPGLHGFHIHATGDLGNNCKNAGGHFNPFGLNHGGPQDVIRHVEDLGNIEADATGTANIQIFAIQPSLNPSSPAYIGNLAVVVHAGRDDLGKGGNPESLKTGNAGARLGCGIIEVQQQQQQTQQQAAFAKVTIVPGTAANLAGELIVTATGGGVIIEGEITGLTPGLHGFHIHATGDLGNNCKNAGGHFNPFGLNHGGPQDVIRHVGDLGNIEADATGTANIQIFAIQPSLNPSSPAYIGNLAVVVHAGRDDLGKGGNPESLKTGNAGARLGCGIIEVQQQQQQTQQQAAFAKVTIVPGTAANLAGELIVTATGGGVIIEGEITGLTPGLHGFHIHATGDLGNNCKNAGGHFNPFGLNHGGPQDVIRHVGDLGNIEADATGTANIQIFAIQPSLNPSSPAYIGNLAVVVHAGRDDLGKGGNPESLKTGNAGARLGCGIIEVQQQQQQTQQQAAFAKVTIVPGTAANLAGELIVTATGGGVIIEGEITGLTPGLHGFHIHATGDLGNNCKNAGGHFNPFGLNHGGPQDVIRHVGDLGNIEADATGTANIQIFDIQPSLDPSSPAYIGNLAVVVHAGRDDLGKGGNPESLKTGNAGARLGCGIIEVAQHQKDFAQVRLIPGSNLAIAGELVICPTEKGVVLRGEITGLTPGLHGFHIHETGDLGNGCKNAGGHFNPFGANHGGPQDATRHVGDLGNIIADERGTAVIEIFDDIASMDRSSTAYIGNLSVVVHADRDDLGRGGNPESLKTGNAGARMGCGIIEVEHFSSFPPVTQRQLPEIPLVDHAVVEIIPGTNPNITGNLLITKTEGGVVFAGQITGLTPGLHGFHIHSTGDLGNSCKNAGGHFNPFGLNHGGPEDAIRHVGDLGNIEADETGTANIQIFDTQPSLDPFSLAYIGSLSVVVHAGRDDLGRGGNPESLKTGNAGARMGCGVIQICYQQQQQQQKMIYGSLIGAETRQNGEATVRLVPGSAQDIAGELLVTGTQDGVIIKGQIIGLTPGLHGFHIHETGDLGNGCKNAGGHFNPFRLNHGGPGDANRHVGDLGNIEVDETGKAVIEIFDSEPSLDPSSITYIGNLSVVVHAGRDDLGKGGNPESLKTGNAGARMGCGVINVLQEQHRQRSTSRQKRSFIPENFHDLFSDPFRSSATDHFGGIGKNAHVKIIPGNSTKVHGQLEINDVHSGLIIKGIVYGLKPGLHGFHVHEKGGLGNKCQDAGGHFNPFNTNHGDVHDFHRHVGDLGNIKADGKGVAHIDIFDHKGSLDPHAKTFIGKLAIVVHANPDDLGRGKNEDSKRTGNSGTRVGCGVVELKSTSHGGHHGHHFHGHAAHHSQPVHHGHHPYPSHHHQPHHKHHQTHSSYHHVQHLGHPQKQHHGEKHHTSHHHNVPVYKPKEKPQLNLGHGQSHNHDHGFGHGFGPENFY